MISYAELTLGVLVALTFLAVMVLPWLLVVMSTRKSRRH